MLQCKKKQRSRRFTAALLTIALVLGMLGTGIPATAAGGETVRVDDTDAAIHFYGVNASGKSAWSLMSENVGDYNNTQTWSVTADSYAEYSAVCTRMTLGVRKGPGAGIMDIYLDGRLVAQSCDCYAASRTPQSIAYDSGVLEAGLHTLKVVCLNQKNPEANNTTIMLDFIDYTVPTDAETADAVVNQISALPAAGEITLEDEAAVAAVRTAYEAPSDSQNALVANLAALEAAEAKIHELKNPAGGDATLSSLTAGSLALSPAFSPAVTEYTVSAPSGTGSVVLSAEPADSAASVPASDLGEKTLEAGINTFVIHVAAESGTQNQYTVRVIRLDPPEAGLSGSIDAVLPDISSANGEVWYKMDDAVGSAKMLTATDGAARDTIELSGTFVPGGGRIGGALRFDGTGDYVKINNDNIGPNGFLHGEYSQITLSLWVKPASLTGRQMIYKQGGTAGGLALRIRDGALESAVAAGSPCVLDPVPLTERDVGRWMHVALVFDKGTASLYLDGVLKSTKTAAQSVIPAATKGSSIGRNMYAANAFGETAQDDQWFSGMLDDFRIYRIPVIPQAALQALDSVPVQSADYGSAESALVFPGQITAYLSSALTRQIPVTNWTAAPPFDGTSPGLYLYTAELNCPAGLINKYGLTATAKVIVREQDGQSYTDLYEAEHSIRQALSRYTASSDITAESLLEIIRGAIPVQTVSADWSAGPVIAPPTETEYGLLTGTLTLTYNGTVTRQIEVSQQIMKPDFSDETFYLQCADKKNFYIYNNNGAAAASYMISEEKRGWKMVSGLAGEGCSFRLGDTDSYLLADGDSLAVGPAVSEEQKKAATFYEEPALGAKPAWGDVYEGGFCSYRAFGGELYLKHTGDTSVGLAAVDRDSAEDRGRATFKKTGDQTALALENFRGSVYYPSYAFNAPQFWKYYDPEIIERDMQYAKKLGINAYRIWVSYEYWLEEPEHFKAAYDDFLNRADRNGIKILVSLFDGCGANNEYTSESRTSRDPNVAVCITSPAAAIHNNPNRYDEPLEFVTWFLHFYKNDRRHMGIEIYNEPWGAGRENCARYLAEHAVTMQGCVPLSMGTAPGGTFTVPYSIELGMDILQYHDNFPSSAAVFENNALSKIQIAHNGNLPVYCTEIQWVGGPSAYSSYENLASTVEKLRTTSSWGPFYWTLMVHPCYLSDYRNIPMRNGLIQDDGGVWSLAACEAIAPEQDFTGAAEDKTDPYLQFYYKHTFSDNFMDQKGFKWSVQSGDWSAADGSYKASRSGMSFATLTDFADFGMNFRVTPPAGGMSGMLARMQDSGNGYFVGVNTGTHKLVIGKLTDGGFVTLVSASIETTDAYTVELSFHGSSLAARIGSVVVTAGDMAYASGQIGVYASSGNTSFDDIHASVSLGFETDEPVKGDVNSDGTVDTADVAELRRLIISGNPDAAQLEAGDLDESGALTENDVLLLLDQLGILAGDANGDGIVSPLDVMVIRKILLGGAPTGRQLAAGDLDGNGSLGVLDIMKLRKKMISL